MYEYQIECSLLGHFILESYIKSGPRRYAIECMKDHDKTNHIPRLLRLEVVPSGVKRSLVADVVEWGISESPVIDLNSTLICDDLLVYNRVGVSGLYYL